MAQHSLELLKPVETAHTVTHTSQMQLVCGAWWSRGKEISSMKPRLVYQSLSQLKRSIEKSVLVLMHGMPVAISMIVLSERYNFYKETIASLILVSSLGAGIYLNLWLLLLGYQ